MNLWAHVFVVLCMLCSSCVLSAEDPCSVEELQTDCVACLQVVDSKSNALCKFRPASFFQSSSCMPEGRIRVRKWQTVYHSTDECLVAHALKQEKKQHDELCSDAVSNFLGVPWTYGRVKPLQSVRMDQRIVVIPDTHGDVDVLLNELALAGVVNLKQAQQFLGQPSNTNYKADTIWTGGDSIVVQLGDMIDGNRAIDLFDTWRQTKASYVKALSFLLRLKIVAKQVNEDADIFLTLGNHELMHVYALDNQIPESRKSYGVNDVVKYISPSEARELVPTDKLGEYEKTLGGKKWLNGTSNFKEDVAFWMTHSQLRHGEPLTQVMACTVVHSLVVTRSKKSKVVEKILFVHGGWQLEEFDAARNPVKDFLDEHNFSVKKVPMLPILFANELLFQYLSDASFRLYSEIDAKVTNMLGLIEHNLKYRELADGKLECDAVKASLARLGVSRQVVAHTPHPVVLSLCDGAVFTTDVYSGRGMKIKNWTTKAQLQILQFDAAATNVLAAPVYFTADAVVVELDKRTKEDPIAETHYRQDISDFINAAKVPLEPTGRCKSEEDCANNKDNCSGRTNVPGGKALVPCVWFEPPHDKSRFPDAGCFCLIRWPSKVTDTLGLWTDGNFKTREEAIEWFDDTN